MQEQLASTRSPAARRPASNLGRHASRVRRWLAGAAALSSLGFMATPAHAVPAYARQTGQDCIACHVGGFGPQLTAFGRAFKLGGYTLQGGSAKHNVPLSAMLVASYTHMAQPYGDTNYNGPPPSGFSTNNNFTALQQASVFLAGRLTDHVGVFGQATYSDPGSQTLSWDNTDLRYAHDFKFGATSGLFGVSLNNNPTLSDVWNTVPAWQFSYMSPPFGNSGPTASPLIYNLGQGVIGATAYALLDNHWYGEFGLYHNLSGYWGRALEASPATLANDAPYYRFWYSNNIGPHVFEVGLLGMNAKLDNGISGSPTDDYRDIGADATYQFLDGGPNLFTANFIYMHERADLNQSEPGVSNKLDNTSLNGSYWYENTYGATLGFFNSSGSADTQLYSSSASGSPDTRGEIIEFDWNPFGKSWTNPEKNLRVGLQYTLYNKFLGASSNFDGNGTNASDMNTLYVYLWTAI